jgi:hypothetical protein
MGEARFNFGIDIFLDLRPVFWLGRRVLGDQWAEVARVNGGENSALGDGVEVIDDCGMTRLA